MSYAELVAETHVDGDEVYSLVGTHETVPDLSSIQMSPELELWKEQRRKYDGETIVPKLVTFDTQSRKPHGIAWVRRVGVAEPAMEDYDYYQISCDCLPAAEAAGNPGAIFSCKSLVRALYTRARMVDKAFRNSETLLQNNQYSLRTGDVVLNTTGREALGGFIISLLNHTEKRPHVWLGNYLAGSHDVNILAMSTGQDPNVIMRVAKRLEGRGLVEFRSDTNLTLSDSYRSFVASFAMI